MEKNIEISLLLDFYGELLKPQIRQMIDLYYNDDLSLSEVASQCAITRQGVRDNIKRGETQLFEYEKKLGLMRRFRELESGLDTIFQTAAAIKEQTKDKSITELAAKIQSLAGGLKE